MMSERYDRTSKNGGNLKTSRSLHAVSPPPLKPLGVSAGSPWPNDQPKTYAWRRTYRSVAYGTWQVGAARRLLSASTSDYSLEHSNGSEDHSEHLDHPKLIEETTLAARLLRDRIAVMTDNSSNHAITNSIIRNSPAYSTLPTKTSNAEYNGGKFATHFHQAMAWRYRDPSTSGDSAVDTLPSSSSGDPSPNQKVVPLTLQGTSSDNNVHKRLFGDRFGTTTEEPELELEQFGGPTLMELAEANAQQQQQRLNHRYPTRNSAGSTDLEHNVREVLKNFRELRSNFVNRGTQQTGGDRSQRSTTQQNGGAGRFAMKTKQLKDVFHHPNSASRKSLDSSPRLFGHQRSHSAGNASFFSVKWPPAMTLSARHATVDCPLSADELPPEKSSKSHNPQNPAAAALNFFRRKLSRNSSHRDIRKSENQNRRKWFDSDSMPATPSIDKKSKRTPPRGRESPPTSVDLRPNGTTTTQGGRNYENFKKNDYENDDNFILRPAKMAEAEDLSDLTSEMTPENEVPDLPRVFVEALRIYEGEPGNGLTPRNGQKQSRSLPPQQRFASWEDAMTQLSAELREIREHDVLILREFQRLESALRSAKKDGLFYKTENIAETTTPTSPNAVPL